MKKVVLFLFLFLPYFSQLFSQKESYPREDNIIRIMSFNVRNCIGLDNVRDYQRTASVIESVNPDIVVIQELDSVTQRSQGVDVLMKLSDITRLRPLYGAAIPYQGGKYGLGILSKERPISSTNVALPGREEARTLLVAEFDRYIVMGTHFSLTEEDRKASVDIINKLAKAYKKPIFLVGDLNAEPESEEIKTLAKYWKILNNTKQATFPANAPVEKIDYIMGYTSNKETYAVHQAQVINDSVTSDHRPLFVDVRLKTANDKVMRTKPYLQNPSTDEMTVMWLTNVPCRSWVEYGVDSTKMTRVRSFIEGEAMANNKINRIRLEGLKPGTKYYYRAVSQEISLYRAYHKEFGDTIRTPIASFTTFDDSRKDFTAVVFNDLHDNYKTFGKLCDNLQNISPDLVIFNGDCIADAEHEKDVIRSIAYYTERIGGNQVPSIFLRGNHETRGAYSMYLWDLLGRQGGNSTYAGFNLGDTRFVLLDCGEDKPDNHWVYYDMNDFTQYRTDQANFLKQEVNSKEFKSASKRVLIHHIPLYDEWMKKEYNPSKELWEPILSKAGFNISLNAHIHEFSYYPIGKLANPYPVVVGGGPKLESATVMILQKKGDKLTLNTLNAKGESILNLDL